jgi:hypothetical protein
MAFQLVYQWQFTRLTFDQAGQLIPIKRDKEQEDRGGMKI